jgi:hypothetical protein
MFLKVESILLSLLCVSCATTRMPESVKTEIISKDHGTVCITFNDSFVRKDIQFKGDFSKKFNSWGLRYVLNEIGPYQEIAKSFESCTIPVPSGELFLKYIVATDGNFYIYSSERREYLRHEDYKEIKLKIEKGKTYNLKIEESANHEWYLGFGGTTIGIPIPKYYQEVELVLVETK